jgi:hypothetical protein
VAGARAAVKFGTKAAKVAKGKGFWSGPGAKKRLMYLNHRVAH